MIQRYIKRDYEKEFHVNESVLPLTMNAPIILFNLFDELKIQLGIERSEQLGQYQDKLLYYLAHQTRKVYLNAQFKASLLELNDYGIFNNGNLDIQAYGHWSEDGTQDAWFTASCFNAVFTMMERKPKWIKVISDNGAHYHNSQLTTLINRERPVDSHHASACKNNIKLHMLLNDMFVTTKTVSNLYEWQWTKDDEHAELVKAQYWRMDLLFFTEFLKPTSETSTPTIPSSPWTMPKPYGLAKTRNKEQLCLSNPQR
ncbi:hypothetical protein GLOIN_2v1772784 [Rhizophagus clarus]|uniref:Uncharacterized protein n=1 Tax=Rhizophagus clarus TaxID=94130 RepID=A0A8H3LTE9_9GLOM|nr:hypothetical protein GLOIN_2v1772784 [Rhizophagus clarus]